MATSPQKAMRAAKQEMVRALPRHRVLKQTVRATLHGTFVLYGFVSIVWFLRALFDHTPSTQSLILSLAAAFCLSFAWARWSASYQCLDREAEFGDTQTQFSVRALWNASAVHLEYDGYKPLKSYFRWQKNPIQAFCLQDLFKDFCKLSGVTHEIARYALIRDILPLNAALNGLAKRSKIIVCPRKSDTQTFLSFDVCETHYLEYTKRLRDMQAAVFISLNRYFVSDFTEKSEQAKKLDSRNAVFLS